MRTGLDVQAKIALIAKLAFGKTVDVHHIAATGISSVDAVDFEYAKLLGCKCLRQFVHACACMTWLSDAMESWMCYTAQQLT